MSSEGYESDDESDDKSDDESDGESEDESINFHGFNAMRSMCSMATKSMISAKLRVACESAKQEHQTWRYLNNHNGSQK